MYRYRYVWIAGALLLILGCGDGVVLPAPDKGFQYFPIDNGRQWVYQVDSIVFDDGGSPNVLDSTSGFVRERITGQMTDLTGDTIYHLERSFRRTQDDNWVNTDIWTVARDELNAYRMEENLRFVKLRFPLKATTTWDPLLFVSPDTEVRVGTELIEMYTNWGGSVTAVDQSRNLSSMLFTDVITCLQADDDNEIERRYVYEEYAPDVGLIMRLDTILDSYCKRIGQIEPCLGLSWPEKGEKGYIMKQQLVSFR